MNHKMEPDTVMETNLKPFFLCIMQNISTGDLMRKSSLPLLFFCVRNDPVWIGAGTNRMRSPHVVLSPFALWTQSKQSQGPFYNSVCGSNKIVTTSRTELVLCDSSVKSGVQFARRPVLRQPIREQQMRWAAASRAQQRSCNESSNMLFKHELFSAYVVIFSSLILMVFTFVVIIMFPCHILLYFKELFCLLLLCASNFCSTCLN